MTPSVGIYFLYITITIRYILIVAWTITITITLTITITITIYNWYILLDIISIVAWTSSRSLQWLCARPWPLRGSANACMFCLRSAIFSVSLVDFFCIYIMYIMYIRNLSVANCKASSWHPGNDLGLGCHLGNGFDRYWEQPKIDSREFVLIVLYRYGLIFRLAVFEIFNTHPYTYTYTYTYNYIYIYI